MSGGPVLSDDMSSSGIRWTPRARKLGRLLIAIGIVIVLAVAWKTCNHGAVPGASPSASAHPSISNSPSAPSAEMGPATVVWTTGGLPADFGSQLAALPGVTHEVTIAGGTAWLTRSAAADGTAVDSPEVPYGIPLEVFAADPAAYAPFLPPSLKKQVTAALKSGKGVLGQTSATLRKVGVDGTLRFGDTRVTVAMIVPDEVVGASELFVSRAVGSSLGVSEDRFSLLDLSRPTSNSALAAKIQPLVAAGQVLQIAAPGKSRFLRADGHEVPPVLMKLRFGEFEGHPDTATAGAITIDPAWVTANIQTRAVPLLGKVTCNIVLFPQLIGALGEIQDRGLASAIHSTSGCYAPRTVSPSTSVISPHAWGAAIDINPLENITGETPTQDPQIVRIFKSWGFLWGGDFAIPDGMHFEYLKPPPSG